MLNSGSQSFQVDTQIQIRHFSRTRTREPHRELFRVLLFFFLPEQMTSSLAVELPEILVPHSLSEVSDPKHDDEIHHTGSCIEPEVISLETAEPQSSCLQTTDDDCRFQSDQPSTGLHSPWCFISSIPIHLLVPPTNLTSLESVQREEKREIIILLIIIILK